MKPNIYICLDIETCRIFENFKDLTEKMQELWIAKDRFKEETVQARYRENSAFFSLFSKIVCITYSAVESSKKYSFCGEDEVFILNSIKKNFAKISEKYNIIFVGHNINGFDIPFIIQRCIINNIYIPEIFRCMDCKPWELNTRDTMLLWKATSNEWYSLEYICTALNLPSPKSEANGSLVAEFYFNKQFQLIQTYCESDVESIKQVYFKLTNIINL
jgi:predicted PolB exonuclease-like 3'-5' exonuclease